MQKLNELPHNPIGYDVFLREKIDAARISMRLGKGISNDEVETEFSARREHANGANIIF